MKYASKQIRILLIRDAAIAISSLVDVRTHKLLNGKLQGTEPWVLFSNKAFSNYPNKTCPPQLKSLALKLVKKCGGLPLALVTLGAHMSSKMQEQEWTDVFANLNWQLSNNPDLNVMKSILLLSFSDLPYLLKHCFLYCCLFPENYPVSRKRLIRRWIAEGFVEGGNGITAENEADSCLSALVFRSMLLVEKTNDTGRPKVVKMHDVMREFALETGKKEKFCGIYDEKGGIDEFGAYRLSIFRSSTSRSSTMVVRARLPHNMYMSRVRSLSLCCRSMDWLGYGTSGREFLRKFKMLRVLDLQGVDICELAHEVGNLFNLRYLNVRGTDIEKLPNFIGRLFNLHTLDMNNTWIEELPIQVGKLQNLRYLIMKSGPIVSFGISKLNRLQVLTGVF